MSTPNFSTCHCHPQSLDSGSTVEAIAKREVELGTGSLTMTDHGTLAAARTVYDAAQKYKLKPILGCLLPGQLIHTINGAKKIEDIQVGDLVLTHKGRFRSVVKTMNRHYDGGVSTIYVTRGPHQGVTVTDEHPILVADSTGKQAWLQPHDIICKRYRRHVLRRHSRWDVDRGVENSPTRTCTVCETTKLNSEYSLVGRKDFEKLRSACKKCASGEWVHYAVVPKLAGDGNSVVDTCRYLSDTEFDIRREGVYQRIDRNGRGNWYGFPTQIQIDTKFAYFLGLFFAEGAASTRGCSLTFNIKETEYTSFCVEFLRQRFQVNATCYARSERGSIDVVFCCKPLNILLAGLVGVGAHNKKVPEEILNSPHLDIRQAFWQGAIDGDGAKRGTACLKLSSRDGVWGVRALNADQGVFTSVRFAKYGGFESWCVSNQQNARHRSSRDFGSFVGVPIKKIVRSHYVGNVYNIHVEEDNSYVSDIALHNCEGYFRDDDCPILAEAGIVKAPESDKPGAKETVAAYNKYFHLTMHSLSQFGFERMVRILSRTDLNRSEQHGQERKPLFNWADLEELLQSDMTLGSGCLVGMVQRHLVGDTPRPDLAVKYYERLRSLVPQGNFYVEICPHDCSKNWVKAVFVEFATTEGVKPPDRRYWFGKQLRVDIGGEVTELPAFELAARFVKWNGKAAPTVKLLAVKNMQTWTPEAVQLNVLFARTVEDFLSNECTQFAPNGDVQEAANKFMLQLAYKYHDPILVSDDSHFAKSEDRVVQDLRMLSGERAKTKGSNPQWRFYGCFEGGTLVDMPGDEKKPISEVRVGDSVLSFDFATQRVVAALVKAVIPTPASVSDFVAHRAFGVGSSRAKPKIVSTPSHLFWDGENWTPVIECKRVATRAPAPTVSLEEAIAGTLLGDGGISLAGRTRLIPYYGYGHALDQCALTNEIAQALGRPTTVTKRSSKHGFANAQPFVTVRSAHPMFGALRRKWYPNGKKVVPIDLKLTPITLAWWFMDDGSRCVSDRRKGKPRRTQLEQFRLYTNGFSVDDTDRLVDLLAGLGIRVRKYNYGLGWFLVFRKGEGRKLQEMIAPYVLPDLQYKLSPEFRGRYVGADLRMNGETVYTEASLQSVEVGARRQERYYRRASGRDMDFSVKYDIEVEGHHCFFVEGTLVHNSYHRQTSAEAFAHFKKTLNVPEVVFEKWVENSHAWRDRFGWKFKDRKQLPEKFYPSDTLPHLMELIKQTGRMDWNNKVWVDRLTAEVKMLKDNGVINLLPYFFLAQDGIRYYEEQGHLPGPGRGSAAGMLLAYVLGITHVDPIRYGLSKERFLTESRIRSGKLPDIDMDFGTNSRHIIIDPEKGWLKQRFGDHCAQISTDTMLRLKSSIQDAHRMLDGEVPAEVWGLTNKMELPPQGISDHNFVFGYKDADGQPVEGSVTRDPALVEYVQKYPKHWGIVARALGVIKGKGRHASAFVVTNEPVSNFIPVTRVGDVVCTDYNMKGVESAGGIKMDYLGVSSLDDIEVAIRLIQEQACWKPEALIINGKRVPPQRIVPVKGDGGKFTFYDVWDLPEDREVFNDICAGRTNKSTFQLGTPSAQQCLAEFMGDNGVSSIKSIEDLAAFTALDRPGGLDSFVDLPGGGRRNMLSEFAARAGGKEACLGRLGILDELIPETYGVPTYQEQLQRIFMTIGSTTPEEGDEFRVHVSKKQAEKVMADKAVFMKGAIERIGKEDAERLWGMLEAFANYGFNKSHAVCYMVQAYACAWLQHYFPLEWWAGVLRNADRNEIDSKFWSHVSHLVDQPDVKLSGEHFDIQDGRIRAPLRLLAGIGPTAHEELVQGRPYKDLRDFLQRIKDKKVEGPDGKKGRSAINQTIITKLVISGCADGLFPPEKRGDVYTKLTYLAEMDADVNSRRYKKTGALKVQPVDPRFLSLSPMQRFLLTKGVLPSHTAPLLEYISSMGRPDWHVVGNRCYWKCPEPFNGQDQVMVLPGRALRAVFDGAIKGLPPKSKFACVAYISEAESFWNGKALRVDFEVDGERFQVVKWPTTKFVDGEKMRTAAKLPEGALNGVAILSVARYDIEKAFSIDDVVVVTPAFSLKLSEQSP